MKNKQTKHSLCELNALVTPSEHTLIENRDCQYRSHWAYSLSLLQGKQLLDTKYSEDTPPSEAPTSWTHTHLKTQLPPSLASRFDLHSSELRTIGTCGKAIIKEKQSRRLNKGYVLCKVWGSHCFSDPCPGKKDVCPSPHLKRRAETDKRRLPGGTRGAKSRGTKDRTHEERERGWHGHRRCGQTPCIHSRDTWFRLESLFTSSPGYGSRRGWGKRNDILTRLSFPRGLRKVAI